MSNTTNRSPCPECKSSNNLCTWEYKGREYTKCKTPDCLGNKLSSTRNEGLQNNRTLAVPNSMVSTSTTLLTSGKFQAIPDRGLTKEVCELYNYQVAEWRGKDAHIANYYAENGTVAAQKVRLLHPKSFFWNGSQNEVYLFGQHLKCRNLDRIWVTEGEIDCLSVAQLMPNENVVSIKTGAGDQCEAHIRESLEYLQKFSTVIFCFDSTDCGPSSADTACKLLKPGHAGLVCLKLKDANQYLQEGREDELLEELKAWKPYIPEALKQPSLETLLIPESKGLDLPYPQLNKIIKGIKPGRLYTLMAGSGIGKSSFTKEIVYHLINNSNIKAGVAYLEEAQKTSAQSFIALDNNVPLHDLEENPETLPHNDFKASYLKYIGKKLWFLNASFLKLTGQELIYNLDFMITAYGCSLIVLDHVTMVTYDMGGESGERKDLDILMKNLRQLVHRTQASIIVVTHLKRPTFGKSYDEGREVHMSDARSSGAIEQLSDVMIALERDMLSDNNNKTKVKVLKNRITGLTGYVDELSFINNTGRLVIL